MNGIIILGGIIFLIALAFYADAQTKFEPKPALQFAPPFVIIGLIIGLIIVIVGVIAGPYL